MSGNDDVRSMSSTLLMKEGGRGERGSRMVMISKMTMMIVAIIMSNIMTMVMSKAMMMSEAMMMSKAKRCNPDAEFRICSSRSLPPKPDATPVPTFFGTATKLNFLDQGCVYLKYS